MISRKILILGFVIACLLFSPRAFADSAFNWNTDNGGKGDWSDPDHWNPKGSTPGGSDQNNTFVSISAPTSGTEASEVSLSGDASINSLSIGPRISPLPLSIVGENSLNVGSGSYLTFLGSEANPKPQINNAGIINLRGILGTGYSELDWTEITGTGKIRMLGEGQVSGHFQNRQVIEGEGNIAQFMSNQGTIRATDGYILKLFASTYNEGGVLTTDGWTNGEMSSELFIGADIEKGVIDANGALVRFVTSGPIKDLTLTGGRMVFEYPGPRFSGAIKINPDVVLSSTTGIGVGSLELQLLDKTTLENNGVVRFADGAVGALTVRKKPDSTGSNATLTGTGRMILMSGGPNSGAQEGLTVDPDSWLVHEINHTIEGSGNIHGGSITNKGQIIAKDGTLKIGASILNSGTMGASPGGILELMSGSIFQGLGDPGNISPNGGIIRLTGATVANGEWGPGNVEFYYSFTATQASPAVTLSGNNHFSSETVVDFVNYSSGAYSGTAVIAGAGTLTNDGTIRMNGPATLYSGVLNSPASTALLTGSGQLILVPGTYNPSLRDDGSCTHGFINDTNHTIRGAGSFFTPVENRGAIIVENGFLAVSQPLTGTGSIQVKDSGVLSLAKDIQTGNLSLDANSILRNNDFNKTIELSGNFSFAQTDEAKWTRGMPILKMNGGRDQSQGIQTLEVGSEDKKLNWDAFYSNTNFRLKKLSVEGNDTWVSLVDAIDNGNRTPTEVLYVDELHVNPGATLNLNGLTLYTISAGNLHLVAAGEGNLFGGGSIINNPGALPGAIVGDINKDSSVNLTDAILALKVIASTAPSGVRTNYAKSGADVNKDGKVGLAEAIYILQTIAGMR
jgi:hypothetical protein